MIRVACATFLIFLCVPWTFAAGDEPAMKWKGIGTWAVAFSGDGKSLAAGGRVPAKAKTIQEALAPTDGLLKVWDVGSGREVFSLSDAGKNVACLAFSPQGSFVAVGYEARDFEASGPPIDRSPLIVWNVAEKKKLLTLASTYRYQSVAFSPNGKWLASAAAIAGEKSILLTLWEMPSGKRQRQWKLERDEVLSVRALAFSPDNKHLAVGGGIGFPQTGKKDTTKGTLRVVHVESGETVVRFSGYGDRVKFITFSPDGKYLACATDEREGTARVYDWAMKKLVSDFKPHTVGVDAVAFASGSKVLFTLGAEKEKSGRIRDAWKAWDVPSGRPLHSQKTDGGVTMAISPDGSLLATGGPDGVQLWNIPKELQGKR